MRKPSGRHRSFVHQPGCAIKFARNGLRRMAFVNDKRIYLRLGDKVSHRSYTHWGEGVVIEEMTSTVPGGTCLVRIVFQDGRQRTFNNDMDSEMCCYYFGVRKFWDLDTETFEPVRRARRPRRITSR
jgi:hypothetical protein